jgi:hypothetical protein
MKQHRGRDSITIDKRFWRRLVRAGRTKWNYRLVKTDGADDLVFQRVKDGKPVRENSVLTRIIKPVGRGVGLDFVN